MQKMSKGMMVAMLFILSTGFQWASAQSALSGKVTDEFNNHPLDHANLTLEGKTTYLTYTNDRGYFLIEKLPEGKYSLTIRYLGYKDQKTIIEMGNSDQQLEFSLQKRELLIQPIEVTSTRTGKVAPFTQTTIRDKDLATKNLGQDLPFLLQQQPGVVVSSDAGTGIGYSGMWIRGSDLTRINMTMNGIPVNDAESANTFFVNLPDLTSSVSDIQIQRGVGTSTNGTGAFGATVNLSTNSFKKDPYGIISSSAGSFQTFKNTVKVGSGLLNDHFTVDARLSSITSKGYIDRAASDLKSFFFSGAYLSGKNSIRLNIISGKEKTYQAWDGVPEDSLKAHRTYNGLGLMPDGSYYKNQNDNYIQTYYQLFWNHEFSKDWNFSLAAFLTKGDGYYEEYKMNQSYDAYGLPNYVVGNEVFENTDLIRTRALDNSFYGNIFSLNYQGKETQISFGGGWSQYEGKHFGDVLWANQGIDHGYRFYHNPAEKMDFNFYGKINQSFLDRWNAYLDLQLRNISYKIDGFKDYPGLFQKENYTFFNPKIGLSYQLGPEERLYFSYSRGNKEPNRDDFKSNTDTPPSPETLNDFELGYDQSGDFYHLHGNLYYMQYKNQLVLTGQINDVGAYTRTNVPNSYRAGIELSGAIHFLKVWTLSANWALSRNKVQDYTYFMDDYDSGGQKSTFVGTADLSFSPSSVGNLSLKAEPIQNLTLELSGQQVGRRFMDNTSNKRRNLPSYWVSNFNASYRLTPNWATGIQLNLLVNNLLNNKYLGNGYTYAFVEDGKEISSNNYFPQAGINFLLGLEIEL